MRARGPLSLLVAAAASAGCIERALVIESDPAGAEVRLNGTLVGTTPVWVPFRHYGDYEIELRKEGFATLAVAEPVRAPFYARFPLCLFTELLWPGRIRDERYLSYTLEPPSSPDRAELLEAPRAGDDRADRLERVRQGPRPPCPAGC